MFELIHRIYEVLNSVKRFEAGYSSKTNDEMVIKFDEKVYKITIEELGEGEVADYNR